MWNKKDFEGVMLGQFVLNNVSTFSKAEIDQLVLVYRNEFHPNLYRLLDICARRAKLNGKQSKDYWGGDCGELMERHISFIKQESKKYDAPVDDENALYFFLFIVFSLSAKAAKNPVYKLRIVRALKRYDEELRKCLNKITSPEYFKNKLEKYLDESN